MRKEAHLIIKPGDFDDPQVQEILRLHLTSMHATSPPHAVFALDLSGLNKPEISFFTAWEGNELLGCGAIRELTADHAEIKSMRVFPQHLRKGVATRLLEHLLAVARDRGYKSVSLETGSGEAFAPAISLYLRFGFRQGESFGNYGDNGFSRFFHLNLEPGRESSSK
jgi:putative acetyltransferase